MQDRFEVFVAKDYSEYEYLNIEDIYAIIKSIEQNNKRRDDK